jgi:hypothetical protein
MIFGFGRRASQAEALEAWREAARLVSARWERFRTAEPVERQWAFASFVAALDAEEAAAAFVRKASLEGRLSQPV